MRRENPQDFLSLTLNEQYSKRIKSVSADCSAKMRARLRAKAIAESRFSFTFCAIPNKERKMKRKLIAFLLTLCLLLAAFPLQAAAAEQITLTLTPGDHVQSISPTTLKVAKGTPFAYLTNIIKVKYEAGYTWEKYYLANDPMKKPLNPVQTRLDSDTEIVYQGKEAEISRLQLQKASNLESEVSPGVYKSYIRKDGKEYIQPILYEQGSPDEHHFAADQFDWEIVNTPGNNPTDSNTKLSVQAGKKYAELTIGAAETVNSITVKAKPKQAKYSAIPAAQLEFVIHEKANFRGNQAECNLKFRDGTSIAAGESNHLVFTAYNEQTGKDEEISPAEWTHNGFLNAFSGSNSINELGEIFIAEDELTEGFVITVKYNKKNQVQKTARMAVTPKDYQFQVVPENIEVLRGETKALSGKVIFTETGKEVSVQGGSIAWTVKNSTKSTINSSGVFTYAADEPLHEIEVEANLKIRLNDPRSKITFKIKEKPTLTGIVLKPEAGAQPKLKPGESLQLKVYGQYNFGGEKELPASDVAFALLAVPGSVAADKTKTADGTVLDDSGKLTAAQDEFKDKLTAKASYQGKSHEIEVEIERNSYTLKLKPENQALAKGSSKTFTAYVEDDATKAKVDLKPADLTWSIVETATDSSVADGVFQYGANESVSPLTVKAELKYAPKTATATVMEYIGPKLVLKTDLAAPVQMKPGQTTVIKAYRKQGGIETPIRADEVTFSLVSAGTSIDTKIDESGRLSIANDEFKDMIKVKAVYKADSENMDELPISIHRTPYTLQLKPKNSTVNKGESKQFTAYVIDNATHEEVALKPTDLTWKAFVGTEAATQSAITAVGVFTCGAAETASEVAIKATLKYDLSKMDDAVVKVGAGSSNPLAGYDNGSSNTGSPAAPAPQQPKKSEDNKPQDKKMDKSSEIIGQFQDIAGHWAQKAIVSAIEKGIFKGVTENSFAPERQMSRAEFITVLGRMSEQATMLREVPFKDVDANAYYAQHVAWGAALGLMKGFEDGTFRPEAKITREQAAVIFANYLKDKKLPEMAMTTFADEESISSWAKAAVKKAAALGLLKGKDGGKFAPKDLLTRAEMAQILDNLSQMLEK